MLTWSLRHGGKERYLRRLAEWRAKRGKKPPQALAEKPELDDDLHPLYAAWHELNHGRQITGMGVGLGLPYSELSRYCEDNGIVGEERARWIRLLRRLDMAYLTEVRSPDADDRGRARPEGDGGGSPEGEGRSRRRRSRSA